MFWLDDEGFRAFYHSEDKHYRNCHSVSHEQNRRNAYTLVIEGYGEYGVCSVGSSCDCSKYVAFEVVHWGERCSVFSGLSGLSGFSGILQIVRKITNNIRKNQKMEIIFYFFSVEIL